MVTPIISVGQLTKDGAVVTRITNTGVEFINANGRPVVFSHAEVEASVRKENK